MIKKLLAFAITALGIFTLTVTMFDWACGFKELSPIGVKSGMAFLVCIGLFIGVNALELWYADQKLRYREDRRRRQQLLDEAQQLYAWDS